MEKDNSFLGTEPVGKLLFRLAVPTIAAQLINMLYNIVDRIYIGHMPGAGDLALTGVGVCMPILMFVSAFAALVSPGSSPSLSPRCFSSSTGRCFWPSAPARTPSATPRLTCRSTPWAPPSCSSPWA